MAGALNPGAIRTYTAGIENYVLFAITHDRPSFPLRSIDGGFVLPTEQVLMGFVTWLRSPPRSLSPSVIKQRVRGTACWFLFELGTDPRLLLNGNPRPRLQWQLKAMSKHNATVSRPRAPLTTDKLQVLLAVLISNTAIPVVNRLAYRALLCLGVFGLCRCGEISTDKIREFDKHEHATRADITVLRDRTGQLSALEFRCRSSKGDPFRRSVTIRVSAAGPDAPMCPVRAMVAYLEATTHFAANEPLFRHHDGSYITRSRVDAMIKRLAHAAGFDTSRSRWSTHSMRAGGATSLSFLGVPAHIIRAYGRWHSDSMLRYLSISHDEHRNIAGLMASMPARDDETRRVAWISLRQQI